MKRLAWVWPSRLARWRRPTLIGASVAAHVVVLGLLSYRAMGLAYPVLEPPPPAIYVEIEPRPLLPGEKARPRPAPVAPPQRQAEAEPQPASAEERSVMRFRLPFERRPDEDEEASRNVPALRPAAPTAPAPPADVGTVWAVRPETMGDRIGRGMRTRGPGCASPQLLTEAERTICEDRFAERAAAAAPITGTGDPERDARFAAEGARALAQYEIRRRPLAGGVGIVGPQDGPGSNFGMGVAGAHIDPSLRPDSNTNIRTGRDRNRELEED
jgi:hypothetical protein